MHKFRHMFLQIYGVSGAENTALLCKQVLCMFDVEACFLK